MTRKYPSLRERIMANVAMAQPPSWAGVDGLCWEWQGTKNGRGYGHISIRKPERKKPWPFKVLVHRGASSSVGSFLRHPYARG